MSDGLRTQNDSTCGGGGAGGRAAAAHAAQPLRAALDVAARVAVARARAAAAAAAAGRVVLGAQPVANL